MPFVIEKCYNNKYIIMIIIILLFIQLCTELRLKGNDHFLEGDYQMAAAFYSRAIKLR